jgi:hypothetical protein
MALHWSGRKEIRVILNSLKAVWKFITGEVMKRSGSSP